MESSRMRFVRRYAPFWCPGINRHFVRIRNTVLRSVALYCREPWAALLPLYPTAGASGEQRFGPWACSRQRKEQKYLRNRR
jgi:hypothetical protein